VQPATDVQARPCRPTVSCTADIVSPGAFEVEAGGLFSKAPGERQAAFPVLLKQTLTPLLQLQVGSNGYTFLTGNAPAKYLDNVFVGPKLHLRDQGDIWPSLALSAQVSLPTFPATGYSRSDNAFFVGYLSKDLGPVHVDWNVGIDVWRLNDSPITQEFTALALSASLPASLGLALEAYAFSDALPVAARDGGLRAALTVTARSWLVLDFGGDAGWFPSTRAYSLFFGMTIVPVVLWESRRSPNM
jgi:hypothetical protein